MKLAGSILSESAMPRREAVLITDFQRTGWQGGEGVRLPDGAVLTAVPIADAEKANLSIDAGVAAALGVLSQQRITVTTGAVNHGDVAGQSVEMTLELGGRGDSVPARQRRPRAARRRRPSIR